MFKYSLDNKRYHTLNYFYRNKFGSKITKVSLNANFSCPNFKNGNGCIFCSHGSGNTGYENKTLLEQYNEVKKIMDNKWPNSKYIGYFQANSNTYAPLNELKEKYELILKQPDVVGLAIATRPDAISNECLNYLEELNKRTFLTIELGLQSMHETTLNFINRGHSLQQFEDMVNELKKRNIFVVAHIINGLPYETKEMMLDTVKYLNKLGIDGIKIHMLHIVKNTPLADIYEKEKFHVLTKEEYIDIVCDELELLNPTIVVERITGDPIKEELVTPTWLLKKFCVLNDIDKEMLKRNSYQGIKNI
ncbi:MAG: TIGR01212 family radical SAM protein [Bacilli bacterium]|nr:TIGR01212 family radical SAM protein [Bacilli bacterium]